MNEQELLQSCLRGVEAAQTAGADAAEVCAGFASGASVSFENNDLQIAMSDDEVTFGIRIIAKGRQGFASTNDPDTLRETALDALAIAANSVVDEHLGMATPRPITPIEGLRDPSIEALDVAKVTELGARLLDAAHGTDARASIDSGSVTGFSSVRAIANSAGIAASESTSHVGGSLFGMAVDGDAVGTFASEGTYSRKLAGFEEKLDATGKLFAEKAIGALHPGKGESYKGLVLFSPEAVASLLVGNLVSMISAPTIRKGKSPLAGKHGELIAAESFNVIDDGTIPGAVGSSSFDREGLPHRRSRLISEGRFAEVLYNHYEARAVGRSEGSTGHASGGSSSTPGVGASALEVSGGSLPLESLIADQGRIVLVNRFSGSTNGVTGEFSGVVKSGFILEGGERRPITETLISGNLLEAYRNIAGISSEQRRVHGVYLMPHILIDGVSVTAG